MDLNYVRVLFAPASPKEEEIILYIQKELL